MAITKILPVRGQLKGCLDYAANPQKTEYFSTADMQRLIGYTQNKDKTEHQLYVSGFNCMPQNAYCIMQATKQRWGKPLNGGNVGYHIIQSFKPGEATPDQVHEIGCEFARRFLADRFECTVSTHLDKGHLHNHIVVNSVSFMDGRMFRNDFTTYYKGYSSYFRRTVPRKPLVGCRNRRTREILRRVETRKRRLAHVARHGKGGCGSGNDHCGQLCRVYCGAAENGVCGEIRTQSCAYDRAP